MSDNAVLSGGCHFSVDCDRYKRGCGCCPQLESVLPEDFSFTYLDEKKKSMNLLLHNVGLRL